METLNIKDCREIEMQEAWGNRQKIPLVEGRGTSRKTNIAMATHTHTSFDYIHVAGSEVIDFLTPARMTVGKCDGLF